MKKKDTDTVLEIDLDSKENIVFNNNDLSSLSISEKIKIKKNIVITLRSLLNGVEDSSTFKQVKKLQNKWKSIGIVDSKKEKSLWSSYNALLDRFYNNRGIYFELKDLDSKKNLENKNKLCDQAEELLKSSNIKDTITKLNKIHNEFKQIGPVPLKEKKKVWNRLKKASDKIYKNKKEFFEDVKKSLKNNLMKKRNIIEKINNYQSVNYDNFLGWKESTKEILLIKDEWEKIGAVPKKESKNINKDFWANFKNFFNNKSIFFKNLDAQFNKNLKLKLEMIKKVESLKNSDKWAESTAEIQSLQIQWKKIGKVPLKHKDKIYKKFKEACDFFFDRKRNEDKDLINEFNSNYKLKSGICDKILQLSKKDKFSSNEILKLQNDFNLTGPVSKERLKEINNLYDKSIKLISKKSDLMNEEEVSIFKFNIELNKILKNPFSTAKLKKKKISLKNKISKIENEVKNLRNNVDFLKSSDNADSLKKDYNKKIFEAIKQAELFKSQLKLIKIN